MKKKKVGVAMSGGVDSGVAAALLVKQGYQCTGFHMLLWKEPGRGFENKCCSTESLEAARKTAHQFGMPFRTVDLSKIFKKKVVDYFLKAYGAGLTPNPCVMCNQFIKFGQLLDYVKKLGFDYLATGHYARIEKNDSVYHLLQGIDKQKDQSYFLYNLTQKQLKHVLFPISKYAKKQVRQMAKKWQLPVAERPESQEICFFPESDYRPFLTRQIPEEIVPGEAVDTQRRVIGKHQGIPLYTIGQRHGFTITDKKVLGPLYVIDKDTKKNQLIVGFGREAEKKEFLVRGVNWISGKPPKDKTSCQVRIRHQGKLLPGQLRLVGEKVTVVLNESERGVASGQAAVFYQREEILGGGIIDWHLV
ncbi:MAG TPA: tRNA 2-thiouridine(34) synthase MnmA [Nevskiaceae bacterium]|nr:tRNA 2-thiouridine(34) synthase MnmA [Nevskiaceae bacterium]